MSAYGKKIAPGVYVQGEMLHIIPEEILAHLGIPDTQENRDMVTQQAKEVGVELDPTMMLIDEFDREPPKE